MHKMSFFPKLIIKVSHNGSFDALIKILETTEHAQIELFILIISVPTVSSLMYRLGLIKLFERMKS